MEQYDKALDYTEKYDDKMVHSIVLSNMSDAYYLIGAYERAVQCHAECIREFEQAEQYIQQDQFPENAGRVRMLPAASAYG